MDVTLRQLRTISEVAERGTIVAAAEALGYTPSAVSQQLAALERTTGVPMLERIGRGVGLTDAGRELVQRAKSVLAQIEEAQAAIEQVSAVPMGEVRLALFESFATALLSEVVRRLRTEHPTIVLRSNECDPDRAIDDLLAGAIDVALVLDFPHAPCPRPHGITWQVIRRERFHLAVPADDPLPDRIELTDVAHRPFVAGSADSNCGRCVLQACREAGFEPDIRHAIDKTSAALRLVAADAGVALLPELALVDHPPGIRLLELTRPVTRTIEVACRESSAGRPAVRALIDAIVAVTRPEPQSIVASR